MAKYETKPQKVRYENESWDVNKCMAAGDLKGITADINIQKG